jgi:hypothetical protein
MRARNTVTEKKGRGKKDGEKENDVMGESGKEQRHLFIAIISQC